MRGGRGLLLWDEGGEGEGWGGGLLLLLLRCGRRGCSEAGRLRDRFILLCINLIDAVVQRHAPGLPVTGA